VVVTLLATTTSALVAPATGGAVPAAAKATPRPTPPRAHRVTGPRVHLAASLRGLTTTFQASSTAAVGDYWWACFGDRPCSAAAPDAHGSVGAGGAVAPFSHAYARAGRYPASITVLLGARTISSAHLVKVRPNTLTAVLTADGRHGTGALPVAFDATQSVAGRGTTWAFCYGDGRHCTRAHPDASGTITPAAPRITLPTASAHVYTAGRFTATLWLASGAATSRASVLVAVTPPVPAPDATCTAVGAVRTCDLYAKSTGSVTVGGSTIPFWGFTLSDAATPHLGGPTLIATEGEQLAFTVHNQLDPKAGNVAITVPSLAGAPDLTGVQPGQSGPSSTLTLTRPGTYVYEAGLTSGGERQVAMGLSGVLIVRPSVATAANATHCAYEAAPTAADCVAAHDPLNYFDQEKTVVVNELDAGFNADPFGSDTAEYHPTNYFIDGVAYDPSKPALDPSAAGFDPALDNVRLDAAAGNSVLLRYADLGLREHSMNLDNLLQSETARDGFALPYAGSQNTEFLNAGESADAFVTIPADAVTGTRFPLYDAGFHLNNGDAGGLGGMYTYLDVTAGTTAKDVGPVGSTATADPTFDPNLQNVDNGQVPSLAVHGDFTAQATAATVSSVHWALDGVPGPTGPWQPTTAAPVPPTATTAAFDFTVSSVELMALLGTEPDRVFGEHTLWLQATDSAGNPGPAIGASFTLAMRDPVISTLSISPEVTNGVTTDANQQQQASTTVAAASNGQLLPQSTLTVDTTAGFPAKCQTPTECQITVGTTIASGPSTGAVVDQAFTYAATTPTTFTGLALVAPDTAGVYRFSTGGTVLLDSVPSGYVAVDATATASLPGWVIDGAQACVTPVNPTPVNPLGAPAPTVASGVEAACTAANIYDLTTNGPAALAAVNGFVPPPTPTLDPEQYWVVVRAQEGPDGQPCTAPGTCRWSPWLYYPTNAAADPATYRTLTMITTGPSTSAVSVSPNPNNGFDAAPGNLGLVDSFDVTATSTSPAADILLAEAFVAPTSRAGGTTILDPPQCTTDPTTPAGCVVFGQGAEMTPSRGTWGHSLTETSTAFLPLSALQGLPDGLVRVWVHSQDVAGNWGPFTAADVTLDHSAPVMDSVVNPAATAPTTTAQVPLFPPVRLPLPAAGVILPVASTAGFPTTGGTISIVTAPGGLQTFHYTGVKSGPAALTGVTGGTGGGQLGNYIFRGSQVKLVVAFTGSVQVTAHDVPANGVSSGISGAEYFTGTDPGPGNATAVSPAPTTAPTLGGTVNFTIGGFKAGDTVNVRVQDAAGNWSAASAVKL
jgi:hypothetical protein